MGVDVDVVNVVERPGIHTIARSGSADCDQMAYSETRVKCLLEIDFSIKTQIYYRHCALFFTVTSPPSATIRGWKCQWCPCITCSTHRGLFDDLRYVYRQSAHTGNTSWRKGAWNPTRSTCLCISCR